MNTKPAATRRNGRGDLRPPSQRAQLERHGHTQARRIDHLLGKADETTRNGIGLRGAVALVVLDFHVERLRGSDLVALAAAAERMRLSREARGRKRMPSRRRRLITTQVHQGGRR